ncbi:adhesion G-protein coupled receptor V1 isoform X2 [Hypomesus transpacificus]|uniref:adhesion G-protein coupled receptor V1 isoform X2 n=1 Tax=Hypomesus transpacificus TaxID=137520 RepID=UPI001F07C583|nr:adhesion G-protein coupled receptor V1 isoform X2 [Hypomesus transpacificus]
MSHPHDKDNSSTPKVDATLPLTTNWMMSSEADVTGRAGPLAQSRGLYVFAVYFLMHNQLCWPSKASYTVEMNGHSGPDATYQGGASTVGGEISKSTQNLISAMEEVSADWERASLHAGSQPSSVYKASPPSQGFTTDAGFINTTLAADEESQEFDDLIFALKTGSGLNMSDNGSLNGSPDGGSMANSQIVELRRIPIADTHL